MKKITPLSRRDFIKTAGVIAGSAALAACVPSVLETPEITDTPIPTSTSKPITPSPTGHPQFVALQDLFSQSETFTLNKHGQVEVRVESNFHVVEGLIVKPDGSITLEYGQGENDKDEFYVGNSFEIDRETLAFDDVNKQLKFAEVKEAGAMEWIYYVQKNKMVPQVSSDYSDIYLLHERSLEELSGPSYLNLLHKLDRKGLLPKVKGSPLRTIIPLTINGKPDKSKLQADNAILEFTLDRDALMQVQIEGKPNEFVASHKSSIETPTGNLPCVITTFKWVDNSGVKFINYFALLPYNYEPYFLVEVAKSIGILPSRMAVGKKFVDNGAEILAAKYVKLSKQDASSFQESYQLSELWFSQKELTVWQEKGLILNEDENGQSYIPTTFAGSLLINY